MYKPIQLPAPGGSDRFGPTSASQTLLLLGVPMICHRTAIVASCAFVSVVLSLFCIGTPVPAETPAALDEAAGESSQEAFIERVRPRMLQLCGDCHAGGSDDGGFHFDGFAGKVRHSDEADQWHEVINVLNEGRMPPEHAIQPTADERLEIVKWVQQELRRAEKALAGSGEVVLRRLNRREYETTVESLFGVRPPGTVAFAKDGSVEGLDNQGQGLFMSPYQMEQYLDVALQTMAAVLPDTETRSAKQSSALQVHLKGEEIKYDPHDFVFAGENKVDLRKDYREDLKKYESLPESEKKFRDKPEKPTAEEIERQAWMNEHDPPTTLIPGKGIVVYHPINARAQLLLAGAKLMVPLDVPADGYYRVRVRAGAGPETAYDTSAVTIGLYEFIGGKGGAQNMGRNPVFVEEVRGTIEQPAAIEKTVFLKAGQRRYYLHKGNMGWETDVFDHSDIYRMRYDKGVPRRDYWRGLLVNSFEIEGPIRPQAADELLFSESLQAPFTREKANNVLGRLAEKAFRRPVSDQELQRYLAFHSGSDRASFLEGIRRGAALILSSPQFLYLVEPTDRGEPLSDRELATRLSYFLWSQSPDERLESLAEANRLSDPEVLRGEVRRMLEDPRSSRFVDAFTTGWLGLDRLDQIVPDRRRWPKYTFEVSDLLKRQTIAFVEEILRSDRSVLDVIDSDWDILNAKLARYYNLDHLQVRGGELRPVELSPEDRRGGVLGHGSILTMTSNGTRTSPIVRGAWVLEHLLGKMPPPPPPSVAALEDVAPEDGRDPKELTVKELIELHKQDAACAACHREFDPYGIGLENYDAIGLWRDHEIRYVAQPRFNKPYDKKKGGKIDPSGRLANGESFSGPEDLKQLIEKQRDGFSRHLVEKLLAYAIGRPVGFGDRAAVRDLQQRLAESDYRLRPLIEQIVLSPPFLRK